MAQLQAKAPSSLNRWRDNDDFEKDLFDISDFAQAPSVSPSKYARKARTKASLFDESYEEEKSVPTVAGRGRSVLWSVGGEPGGSPSFLARQKETSSEIRQTTNGFGYSNDQIEHMLKDNSETSVKPMENVKLSNSQPSSINTSRSSTPFQSSGCNQQESLNNNRKEVPPLALSEILRTNVKPTGKRKTQPDNPLNIDSLREFPKL